MALKQIVHTDNDGRKKVVLLPEEAKEEEADIGIPVGPPSLEELGLPEDIEIRLNNELFNRGILTPQDALRGRAEILGAIQSTLKVSADRIVTIYVGRDYKNARSQPAENISNSPVPHRGPRKPRK